MLQFWKEGDSPGLFSWLQTHSGGICAWSYCASLCRLNKCGVYLCKKRNATFQVELVTWIQVFWSANLYILICFQLILQSLFNFMFLFVCLFVCFCFFFLQCEVSFTSVRCEMDMLWTLVSIAYRNLVYWYSSHWMISDLSECVNPNYYLCILFEWLYHHYV